MTGKPESPDSPQENLRRLSEKNGIFSKVLHILELIANSKSGLGEVMQDYARQTYRQLKAIIQAGQNIADSGPSPEDAKVLQHADDVIKTISRFLEMAPRAMERNNAETIGKEEKISKESIQRIGRIFATCPETKLLLTYQLSPESLPHPAQLPQTHA